MFLQRTFSAGWLFLAGVCCLAPVRADDPAPPAAAPDAASPSGAAVRVGIDQYIGVSNIEGNRRFSDGFWAGSSAAFPSVAYLRWENGRGSAAKVSLGLGKMYTGPESALDQPVEAWVQVPAGGLSLTVGKFWVPFAIQEWQYETKPGAMLQWARGPYMVAISGNYNENTRRTNTYLRLGRSIGEDGAVGISLGAGKGLSYDSEHDRAWALDATYAWRGWRLSSEYFEARTPAAERFTFAFGKLAYENAGAWQPFLARYSWKDASEAFGSFGSTVYGLGYRIRPGLTVEGAYAPTSDKNTTWVQMHWTWER